MEIAAAFEKASNILTAVVIVIAVLSVIDGLTRGFWRALTDLAITLGSLAIALWTSNLFMPVTSKVVFPMIQSSARVDGYGKLWDELIKDEGNMSGLVKNVFGSIATFAVFALFYVLSVIILESVRKTAEMIYCSRTNDTDGYIPKKKRKAIDRLGGGLMKLLKIWVSLYVLIMPLAGVCDISKDILADPAADKCLELLGKEYTGQEIYDSTAGIISENFIVSGVYNAWGDVHFRYLTTFSQNCEKITLKDGYSEIQKYVSGLPEEVFVRENESAETGNNTDAASSEESEVPDTAN